MTTTTRPPSFPPRVIEHDPVPAPAKFRLPEQSLRGVLAGIEALVLGWLALTVPTVAVYVATAAEPALGSAGWTEAVQIGTAVWFVAHGAPLNLGDAAVSITPLGLTMLFAFLVSVSVRRARLHSWPPVLVTVGTYLALSVALVFLADTPGAVWGLVGAAIVPAIGASWGMRRRYPALPPRLQDIASHIPTWLVLGWRGLGRSLAVLVGLATLALIVSFAAGFGTIAEIHRMLHADPLSSVVLVLAQLAVLPVLAVWALSFMAGPGFSVGEGTLFSPAGVESGPLPLIPVLGALPRPDSLASDIPILPIVLIVAGVGIGVWLARSARTEPLWHALAALGVAGLGAGVVVLALAWQSAGSIGPGAMAHVGPHPGLLALAVLWRLLVGGLAAVLLLHPGTRRGVARGWHAVRHGS